MIKNLKKKRFINKQVEDVRLYGIKILGKKFFLTIKILIRFLFNILALIPCFIIRLLSPWIIIRLERISAGNFGDFVWMTAMYYCKKKLNINTPTKKYLDLVYIRYKGKVYNKQIAKMWKRKLNLLPGYLLDPIRTANRFIPGWRNHIIENLCIPQNDIDNLFEKHKSLEFTEEEEIFGKKMLNKFGLSDQDKFVCFAIRDGAYQLKKISSKERDWSYHDYRHTDVDNFMLAAEELSKRGYFVFRMGVVAEKPFTSKNPKIIDYVNSNLRSDFMDIYLGANCSFCLSTGYGFEEVPIVFRKPIAQMVQPLGNAFTHNEKYLILTKHHIFKKEERKLSISEIFSSGAAYYFDSKDFEKKGIELKENSSEEIRDIVTEMIDNIEKKDNYTNEDKELQKRFSNLYEKNIKKINFHNNIKDYFSNAKKDFHGQIRSRFSTKFLRQNKNWLS